MRCAVFISANGSSIDATFAQADELDYAYQAIGFKCFSETLFEDAGRNLFNGKLDPRVLASYFPDLCVGLFTDTKDVEIFAGVAERMPTAPSIEELSKYQYLHPLMPSMCIFVIALLINGKSTNSSPLLFFTLPKCS